MSDPDWMHRLRQSGKSGANPQSIYLNIEDLQRDICTMAAEWDRLNERLESAERQTRRRENEIRTATEEIESAIFDTLKRWQIARIAKATGGEL